METTELLKKVRRWALVGAVAVVLGAGGAISAELVHINPDETSEKIFLLPNSVISSANQLRAWFLTDYETSRTFSGRAYRSAMARWIFDCTAGTSGLEQLVFYEGAAGTGAVIQSGQKPVRLSAVVPGSVGHAMLVSACAGASAEPSKQHRYGF